MTRGRLIFFRALFVTVLWLAAIVLLLALELTHDPPAELRQQAARWAGQQPVRYRYTLNSDRPGASLVLAVDVEDGRASYPRYVDEINFPLPEDPSAYTVDWVFEEIQSALDKGAVMTHSSYDRQYGYPRTVSLDYPESSDENWASYNLFDFTVLEESRGR